jgi:hypothetical protein
VIHHTLQFLSQLQCVSDVGAELGFILPFEDLPNFPKLFTQLDGKLPELGISSYGVAITTLEDVFLKVESLMKTLKVLSSFIN